MENSGSNPNQGRQSDRTQERRPDQQKFNKFLGFFGRAEPIFTTLDL
jgi:hypothetical protein